MTINDRNKNVIQENGSTGCSGYCSKCNQTHALPLGNAREKARSLLKNMEKNGTIDLFSGKSKANVAASYTTEPLFSEERGKMFGVLECVDRSGEQVWLYAYSGQFNGQWLVPGWVPPLFDVERFCKVHDPIEMQIKTLGVKIAKSPERSEERDRWYLERKQLSQNLMRDIHDLYKLHNCAGKTATLSQAFGSDKGLATGTGDCCAPKLLNFAAVSDLTPLSLAEFFFGKENRSQSREHGHYYPPCEKCLPLLGFLLCGIDLRRQDCGT